MNKLIFLVLLGLVSFTISQSQTILDPYCDCTALTPNYIRYEVWGFLGPRFGQPGSSDNYNDYRVSFIYQSANANDTEPFKDFKICYVDSYPGNTTSKGINATIDSNNYNTMTLTFEDNHVMRVSVVRYYDVFVSLNFYVNPNTYPFTPPHPPNQTFPVLPVSNSDLADSGADYFIRDQQNSIISTNVTVCPVVPSVTPTRTATPTVSVSSSATKSLSSSISKSRTPSPSQSVSSSRTPTISTTSSASLSLLASTTSTASTSQSASRSATISVSSTGSISQSASNSPSKSQTASISPSTSVSSSKSITPTISVTISISPSISVSPSLSGSPSNTCGCQRSRCNDFDWFMEIWNNVPSLRFIPGDCKGCVPPKPSMSPYRTSTASRSPSKTSRPSRSASSSPDTPTQHPVKKSKSASKTVPPSWSASHSKVPSKTHSFTSSRSLSASPTASKYTSHSRSNSPYPWWWWGKHRDDDDGWWYDDDDNNGGWHSNSRAGKGARIVDSEDEYRGGFTICPYFTFRFLEIQECYFSKFNFGCQQLRVVNSFTNCNWTRVDYGDDRVVSTFSGAVRSADGSGDLVPFKIIVDFTDGFGLVDDSMKTSFVLGDENVQWKLRDSKSHLRFNMVIQAHSSDLDIEDPYGKQLNKIWSDCTSTNQFSLTATKGIRSSELDLAFAPTTENGQEISKLCMIFGQWFAVSLVFDQKNFDNTGVLSYDPQTKVVYSQKEDVGAAGKLLSWVDLFL